MEELAIPFEQIRVRAEFVAARSDFLDGFARLESEVMRILRVAGKVTSNEPFAQRVRAFRGVEPSCLVAKSNLAERDKVADAIAELLPIRADIVHAEMTIGEWNGAAVAMFVNAQHAHETMPLVRLVSLAEFIALQRKIAAIRDRIIGLRRKANPPSLPPPPSPGAAGGP